MKFTDLFNITGNYNRLEHTIEGTIRLFGIDISLAGYGYLNDWVFPFMFVPKLRGFYLQVLGLGLFIGRLKEVLR